MRYFKLIYVTALLIFMVGGAKDAQAHRSGCHNLHSCPSDSGSYICGDLGYACDGTSSISNIDLASINVPVLVEATFAKIFERDPSEKESNFWKKRFRSDKGSLTKIRRAMRWHKSTNSFGPKSIVVNSNIKISQINALFRVANDGSNPTASQNLYWISRIDDKPTKDAMIGAMRWHRIMNIIH